MRVRKVLVGVTQRILYLNLNVPISSFFVTTNEKRLRFFKYCKKIMEP